MAAELPSPTVPAPPASVASDQPAAKRLARDPRAGELTNTWRVLTALTWIAVAAAFGAVWRTSDQLGLTTWWIGPRGVPNSRVIQLLPFVAPVAMTVIAVNHVRHVAWIGLVASAATIAIGLADLTHLARLAFVEIAIGAVAAALSLASLTGTYRPIQ